MSNFEHSYCPNRKCKDHGLRNHGNIAVRGKYGKDKQRDLLYCRTCGKRFARTHGNALFGMHIPADTVNRVILRAGEHCAAVLSSLLASLELTEAQLDELWTFVKKKKVLEARKTPKANMATRGSGQQ